MGRGIMAFNTTMLFCILFGVLLISRLLLYVLRRLFVPTWLAYSLWIFGEVLVASLFMALYVTLMYHGEYPYFDVVGLCLFFNLIVLSLPYVIISLSVVASEANDVGEPSEGGLIRFHDNTQKLKLVVAADALMYVKAEENYVRIKYLENGVIKDYVLRNTMKSLEPTLQKYGMVRCQRSFFVNPKHVKVLRKDKQGVVVAELNASGADTIPVSPKYYDALERLL
ncbi:MAG: LytTR family transcriptional regulator [Bacteroidales bacterium]|nr:LytTR family transcriptional regulator [Bacteroidales bacterium]